MAIDVTAWLAQIEHELRGGGNPMRGAHLRAVLERWQWDEMLDEASRAEARRLLHEFRARE